MQGTEPVNDEFEVGFDHHGMIDAFSGICTIGFMHICASWAKSHSDWFGDTIDETPAVVFGHGEFNRRRLQRLRLNEQDVMAASSQRGLMRLEPMHYAVPKRGGKISIVQKEAA